MIPNGQGEPIVSFHGTRWPKLPWILKQRSLQGGPREAGGKNGVWTSPVFKTADTGVAPGGKMEVRHSHLCSPGSMINVTYNTISGFSQ